MTETENVEYPSMFGAADKASRVAQSRFLLATKATLILMLIGAGLEAIAGELECHRPALALAGAALFAMSLALTVYTKVAELERTWYGGRAVAESVKSLSWRYMMGAEPFPLAQPAEDSDKGFVAKLASIAEERKELMFGFGGEASDVPQISTSMRELRAAALEARKNAYLVGRVRDQRQWYGDKARNNRQAKDTYFVLVILSQLVAAFASLVDVRWPDAKVHPAGFLAVLASAFIAWLQVRQHSELAQAYSVAEFDLSLVEERALYIADQAGLSAFVADAESAISREHTLWTARRDRT